MKVTRYIGKQRISVKNGKWETACKWMQDNGKVHEIDLYRGNIVDRYNLI
jgi:hypothetical protein